MQKVLILDGNQRSALAATRALGKKGVDVTVADETVQTLAGSSRYCRSAFVYPSPYQSPLQFLETLRREMMQRGIMVLLPMTDVSTYLVLKHRVELGEEIQLPYASFEMFDRLTDKWQLFQLARELNIPAPVTYFIEDLGQLSGLFPRLKYPVVLKPYRSKIFSEGRWISTSVRYAGSASELEHTVAHTESFSRYPFLIQEYILGQGQGVFALYEHGRPVFFFAHRRLREKPPSGGISVLSESVEVDPRMRAISQRILDHIQWHGVAMIEFKVSSDGIPFLMEVNARFWGSLQLAIDAGADFPYFAYRLALGEKIEAVNRYRAGIKSRWLLGDLDHLYLKLKTMPHLKFSDKWEAVVEFAKLFERDTFYEVNRWEDMKPFLFELKSYFRN